MKSKYGARERHERHVIERAMGGKHVIDMNGA